MNDLAEMGFQAINMQQMTDFMYNNAKIPQRSVLLIVDDRHLPNISTTISVPTMNNGAGRWSMHISALDETS